MNKVVKTTAAVIACTGLFTAFNAQAANWLMLQGTESSSSAPRAKVWGFIQPTYSYTEGTPLKAGPWEGQDAQFNLHAPQLDSNKGFNIRRARIGVRGQGHPLNAKVNYFLLAEFGSNGITWPGGGLGAARLSDASVTINYIPGARVRAGLFKTPTAEEGLQAIHVFDYVNFTSFTDQMLLERHLIADGSQNGTTPDIANAPVGPVGAFRDVGVQIFDSFMVSSWDLSYALMVGNGSGITGKNNNSSMDRYGYFSAEKVFAGKGPRRQGLKMFAWGQMGERDLVVGTDDTASSFDRNRYGLGVTFRKSRWRASAEYLIADGMILNGTDGGARVGALNNAGTTRASFNMLPEDEANGYYLHFGAEVINRLELDIRYDVLNRGTETASEERKFETITLGAQWFFDLKNRITLNYEIRSLEAPNLPASSIPSQVVEGIDDRVTLQLTSIF